MDDIAAEAGTSKTVLYRHFADKEQLYLAVAARVDQRVVRALRRATAGAADSRAALAASIAAYLRLVEQDPQVYRFVVHHRGAEHLPGGDPVSGLSDAISAELARMIARRLDGTGIDAEAAAPWAHGLVGLVRAAADHWVTTAERTPTDVLATQLTHLAWGGLAAVLHHPPTAAGHPQGGPAHPAPLEEEHS